MPAHPALHADRWLASLTSRHSRRAFDGVEIDAGVLADLVAAAGSFAPFEDTRAVVVEQAPPTLFRGIIGSYGKVSNSPSAIVFVAYAASPTADEHCGYTGEGIVLEAQAL